MATTLLAPLEKVAILMVALGPQVSANVMKYLKDDEVEKLVEAITKMEPASPETETDVLKEFETLMRAGKYVLEGGLEFARQILANTVGTRRAEEILNRVTGAMTAGFILLKDVDPATIWTLLRNEHPQTIAIILSQLDESQAAGVLSQIPEDRQPEVVSRIASMERVDPTMIAQLEESLKLVLEGQLSSTGAQSGGVTKAANILNLAGRATERSVFKALEIQEPEMAQEIKNHMFTFNDIATSLDNRAIQRLIQEVETSELAKALKAADPLLKEKIFSNVSSRTRDFMMEEIQYMPPVRLSEVEEVQNRIVQIVHQLEDAGEITVTRSGASQEELYV